MEFWHYLIILGLGTLGVVIFVAIKSMRPRLSASQKSQYQKLWIRIKNGQDLKHSILDADKLLDKLLLANGYNGTTGEKLKNAKKLFMDYNGVWKAHKLRNRLAHEIDVKLSNEDARTVLKLFERAFRDLGLF